MTDGQEHRPGTSGPHGSPNGSPRGGPAHGPHAGHPGAFTYLAADHELIVVADPAAALRAHPGGVRSDSGADVTALNRFLTDEQLTLEPLFGYGRSGDRPDDRPDGWADDDELPALFHRVRGTERHHHELAARLAVLPGVDGAYVKPGALPAYGPHGEGDTTLATATPDFTARQGYLGPAPGGVDARWAWTQPGGTGEGVGVVAVEGAWRLGHADLGRKLAGIVAGTPLEDPAWRNHGTSTLGVVGGDRTGRGITGIAPGTLTAAASFPDIGSARAVRAAADRLPPGGLVLVALHRPGPRFGYRHRDDQRGCIPLEWWPDDFAAVRYAAARGVLVVAAGGNGGECLDDPLYEARPDGFPSWWRNPFGAAGPSSGAVLVGAGAPPPGTHGRDHGPDRSRLAFSNHGGRLDAQGWGVEVTTAGGHGEGAGDLQGGAQEDVWYTDVFCGTSAASAMVAGALATVQGVLAAAGREPLSPTRARQLLRTTGSPQQDAPGRPASQRIGNRPDVRAAVGRLLPSRVASGTAERLWDELIPYPPERPPQLRLYVAGAWRGLDSPDPAVRQAVHTAFASGRAGSTGSVRVWYADDKVVGLVVTDSP
ncbi:S8 family serine peptidase [Streptomyces cinnamoneus]|uniref:S8 family serine peptidase n=1 Tax=Streptomyces cinnamoneus TaxID=53446 RepID=UPI00343C9D41